MRACFIAVHPVARTSSWYVLLLTVPLHLVLTLFIYQGLFYLMSALITPSTSGTGGLFDMGAVDAINNPDVSLEPSAQGSSARSGTPPGDGDVVPKSHITVPLVLACSGFWLLQVVAGHIFYVLLLMYKWLIMGRLRAGRNIAGEAFPQVLAKPAAPSVCVHPLI
jgi:hypothetical protein